MTDTNELISPDRPVESPEHDQLGFAPFAQHLATVIRRVPSPEGLVIALHGSWGAGKTTMLHFVERHLAQAPASERIIVVHFNPWWFSGHEDLARRFFHQLETAFTSELKARAKELRTKIADLATLVSDLPVPYHEVAKVAAEGIRPARVTGIPRLKKDIGTLLAKQKCRVLVIIDDVDRLPAEDIRQLFRVIKAVADFPNVVYLVAFDKAIVAAALTQVQGIPGEQYLEKIIQLPLELPLPEKSRLATMLFERLNAMLADTPARLFNEDRWATIYVQVISPLINTPRDVVRLTNALAVTYAAVVGEVDVVDFIALESLRVFVPAAYAMIRDNEATVVGDFNPMLASAGPNAHIRKTSIEAMLAQIPTSDREAVQQLLHRLFPQIAKLYNIGAYDARGIAYWRKERRLCSPDVFPVYFRLAVPEGNLRHDEVAALLDLTGQPATFASRLLGFAAQTQPDGTTRLRTVLDQLQDAAEDIPASNVGNILHVLVDIADQLINRPEPHRGLFDIDNDARLSILTRQLVRRLRPADTFPAVESALAKGKSIYFAAQLVVSLTPDRGQAANPPTTPSLSAEQLQTLQQVVVRKIRSAAQAGTLVESPHLSNVLYFWREIAGPEEPRAWAVEVARDNRRLVRLLEQFGGYTRSQTIGEARVKEEFRLDAAGIAPFLDPGAILRQLSSVRPEDMTASQRLALSTLRESWMTKQAERSDTSAEERAHQKPDAPSEESLGDSD